MTLTPKQQRFVEEYLVDSNGAAAAVRAGYSPKSAKVIACKLLTKAHVRTALEEQRQALTERTDTSVDWGIEHLKDIVERCMQAVPVTVDGTPCGLYTFDASNAVKALIKIGEHHGAFNADTSKRPVVPFFEFIYPDGPLD